MHDCQASALRLLAPLFLAALAASPAKAGSAEPGPWDFPAETAAGRSATSWQDLGMDFRFLAGKSFAFEGEHDAGQLGAMITGELDGWVGGFQATRMGQLSAENFMGIDTHVPLESATYLGLFAGWMDRGEAGSLTFGLGAGRLDGSRRGALLSTEEDCKGWAFSGDCPEEDVVVIHHYENRPFDTISLNPMFSADLMLGRRFAVGLIGQAFINSAHNLGSVALVIRLAS